MQAILKRATEAIDTPVPPESNARKAFALVALAILIAITLAFFSKAMNKTARIEAASEKDIAIEAIDSAQTFGRVYVDKEGTIISWNHGMTQLVGWTSKEMVSGDMDRLDPHGSEEESVVAQVVFKRTPEPWSAGGFMDLLTQDGRVIYVRVNVNDIPNVPYRELNFYATDRFEELDKVISEAVQSEEPQ